MNTINTTSAYVTNNQLNQLIDIVERTELDHSHLVLYAAQAFNLTISAASDLVDVVIIMANL